MGGRGAWRIGGYVADELIGYGASSQVWRGHAGRSAEPVALKVLDLADGSAVRTAKAEAALLSALDHPNLVRLRELLPDGESVVLVLELAAGGSLAQLLDRHSRLSPGEVVAALAPIAAALAYAHDAGVIHSDVSPANVLFRADGSPVLADLGVARLVGDFDAPRSTLAYVDPGVAGGAVPSEASDVFMVAATALHALTGSPPWPGATAEAVLEHAVSGQIEGLAARLSGLPGPVADVLRRGLDPAPIARGSAAEFALDLRHAAAPMPVDLGAGPSRSLGGRQWTDAGTGFPDRSETRAPISPAAPQAMPVPDPGRFVVPGQPVGPVHVARHAAAGHADAAAAKRVPSAASVDVPLERPDFARPDVARSDVYRSDAARSDAVRTGPPTTRPPTTRPPTTRPPTMGVSQTEAYGAGWGANTPKSRSGPPELVAGLAASSGAPTVTSNPAPLALTHVVRSQVRPVAPPPARWFGLGAPGRSAGAVVTVAAVVLLAGGTAAWTTWGPFWSPHRHAAAAAHAQQSGSGGGVWPSSAAVPPATAARPAPPPAPDTTGSAAEPSAPARTSSTPPAPSSTAPTPTTPTPTAPTPTTPTPTARPSSPSSSTADPRTTPPAGAATASPSTDAGWAALLAGLDRSRQRAYAGNDPAPLFAVYADAALLRQDRSTLRHLVPSGCRLLGLRTVYRGVHASTVTTTQAVIGAQASLEPARLVCAHSTTRPMAPRSPVPMTITLRRVGGQFRIDAIKLPT